MGTHPCNKLNKCVYIYFSFFFNLYLSLSLMQL